MTSGNLDPTRRRFKTALIISLLLLAILTLQIYDLITEDTPQIIGLDSDISIKTSHTREPSSAELQRITLQRGEIPISEFEIDPKTEVDMTGTIIDYNIDESKALLHTTSEEPQNIDLYVPRKSWQNIVRICENATSLAQVREGCAADNTITREYVLKLGDSNLDISPNKDFFIVRNIQGTGGEGGTDWWSQDYQARMQINITPTTHNITKGYTLNVSVNTSYLISSGKMLANGSDLRIVYWNGTTNIELDRINATSFNTTSTIIEFKSQENITNSTQTYLMYYDNNNAGTPPENKSNIYYLWEDFEDQTHPFTDGSLNPVVNTNSKKNGAYGLEGDGLAGYRREVKAENLSRGMSIEGWVYSGYAGDNADLPGLEFGAQTTGELNGYQVVLDWRSATGGSADMQIRKNYASSSPLATSTEGTTIADRWYYIVAYWKSNGDINVTVYDANRNYFGSMNINDNSYTTGYYGVGAYRDGFWDDIKVKLNHLGAPTITLGTEEQGGPQITNMTISSNDIHINETVNISADVSSQKGISSVSLIITTPGNFTETISTDNISENYYAQYTPEERGQYTAIMSANDTNGTEKNSTTLQFTVNGYASINLQEIIPSTAYQGQSILVICQVNDSNTSAAIENYNVSIHSNESGLLESKFTNSTGGVYFNFTDSTQGAEEITCTISDMPDIYYSASNNNQSNTTLTTGEPPSLTILTKEIDKTKSGYGNNITITTQVISPNNIDSVFANITLPNGTLKNEQLDEEIPGVYSGIFTDTWQTGNYTFKIWTNDSAGNIKTAEITEKLELTAEINVTIFVNQTTYGPDTTIGLTERIAGWWDGAYNYRQQAFITNRENYVLRENYTMNITVNTATLIAQNKMLSNCDDLRIVWSNGTSSVQLNRVLESSCNSAQTRVAFPLREEISALANTGNYYVYYGKATASSPPEDKTRVYLAYEDFESYAENNTPSGDWYNDPEYNTNNWQIKSESGNNVLQDLSTDGVYHRLWLGSQDWENYTIEAKVKLDPFLFTGIAFRQQPWSGSYYNHYALIIDDRAATNKMTIRRWSGGGSNFQQIAGDNTDFDGLTWHNYTINISGNTITAARDGVLYISKDISADDPKYTTGGAIGLMSHQGNSYFDDIKVKMLVENIPNATLGNEESKATASEMLELGENSHYAYLLLDVQNNNSGTWQSVYTLINDSASANTRLLGTGNSIDLSELWHSSEKWNTTGQSSGTYRIYASLTDTLGNTLHNTAGSESSGSAEFTVDSEGPTVTAISPLNNAGNNGNAVIFEYTASDTGDITSCSIFIDNTLVDTDNTISGSGLLTFGVQMEPGNYLWEINCTDNYGAVGTTGIREFAVIRAQTFDGGTTDLSSVNIYNVTNLIIESSTYGKIEFPGSIDISNGGDWSSGIVITNNNISIDSDVLPYFNAPAILTMYNVDFVNPTIFRDGVACTNCVILEQNAGDIVFSVPSFSSYSISENSKLEVWDTTDTTPSLPEDNIYFYANYTNTTSNQPITSSSCTIYFADGSSSMTYSSGIYYYNRTFNASTVYLFNVTCDGTSQGYTLLNAEDYASINELTGPGAAEVTVISSSRANISSDATAIQTQASNVTQLRLNATGITRSWQSYYGNIGGTLVLTNSEGEKFYDWNITSPQGEVYATRSASTNFATVTCSDPGDISSEESFIGHTATASDSVSNTFSSTTHRAFFVGSVSIPENSCPTTNTYVAGDSQNAEFFEVILTDEVGNTVYTALLNGTAEGFDSGQYDFQMLVGQNGHDDPSSTTPYYFYVEIS